MALDGVTVTLAGAAEATAMTKDGGQYAFAGLAEGTYVVTISGWDEVAYNFDEKTSATIVLGDAVSHIENFDGTQTRTAGISGVLFIDEVMKDGMLTTGEPPLTEALGPLVMSGALDPVMLASLLAKAKVMLRGPDLNTVEYLDIDPLTSTFTSPGLVAGTYQVSLPVSDEIVAAALAAAGVKSVGEATVVTIGAGMQEPVNFPFEITMQTINVGAVMGMADEEIPADRARVEGVTLALYPTAEDAENGTNMLGMEMMTAEMTGMTAFEFARDDDTRPGSEESDNLVFVKVTDSGHDDLRVSDNDVIEIEYPGVKRVYSAPAHVRLLNVAVNVQFWIKSDADARSGDMGLEGWTTKVYMGDPAAEDAMALMKPDPKHPGDDTKMVNLTEPTDMDGKSSFSYMAVDEDGDPALPATFHVSVDMTQANADGEKFGTTADDMAKASEDGMYLMSPHDGLKLPAANDAETNDLGAMRVKFTTQTLVVGVYRETDDEPGWTNYRSRVPGNKGDTRPHEDVSEAMQVQLMESTTRGRLIPFKHEVVKDDGTTETRATKKAFGENGLVTFTDLPADKELTVRFISGSNRTGVIDASSADNGTDYDAYGDHLDEGGSTVGAFGDASGAGPEVRLCPLSASSKDDMCSTFAYQWTTGSISGKITRRSEGLGDKTVNLNAITGNHSESETTTTVETGADKGNYGFSNVQDGEYYVHIDATADHKADSSKVWVYHDEDNDDDPNDGVIGNPWDPWTDVDIAATALRLAIKGYVANVSHEHGGVVRGDEAVEGVELELREVTKAATATKPAEHKATDYPNVMTNAGGFYEFTNIQESSGKGYVVRAVTSADHNYVAVRDSATDHTSDAIEAHEYFTVTEDHRDLDLPEWDYEAGSIAAGTDNDVLYKTAGDNTTAKMTYVNFALLHRDGEFSGRVTEAMGRGSDIVVVLARCKTSDGTACTSRDTSFDGMRSDGGNYEFGPLREGYYSADVGGLAMKTPCAMLTGTSMTTVRLLPLRVR